MAIKTDKKAEKKRKAPAALRLEPPKVQTIKMSVGTKSIELDAEDVDYILHRSGVSATACVPVGRKMHKLFQEAKAELPTRQEYQRVTVLVPVAGGRDSMAREKFAKQVVEANLAKVKELPGVRVR